jgi:hypothetical protein
VSGETRAPLGAMPTRRAPESRADSAFCAAAGGCVAVVPLPRFLRFRRITKPQTQMDGLPIMIRGLLTRGVGSPFQLVRTESPTSEK